jgi:beta-galactosidase
MAMKPTTFFITLAVCCLLNACQTGRDREPEPRMRQNLDKDWKFAPGHASDPARDFNFKKDLLFAKTGQAGNTAIRTDFDDSGWRPVDLPHDWAVELPFVDTADFNVMAHGYKPIGGLYPENSIGWYRKKFGVPEKDSGNQFSLTFDGVFRDAMFWLNGFYLGTNESGYSGVTFPVTDCLRFDGENVLVVRVDATQFEGWFYEGAGIYRHVWLNRTNNIHIRQNGVIIQTAIGSKEAHISLDIELENNGLKSEHAAVKILITDRTGKVVAEKAGGRVKVPVSPSLNDRDRTPVLLKTKVDVPAPRLWSVDDPYLYRATVVVKVRRKEVDRLVTPFGIRSITFTPDKGLYLNGQHIKVKGTNNHQDHAGVGSALPDYLQYWRIRQLKNLGVNAYRTSHNPPTPELLDACDSLGMLVLDETRLLNSSPEYMSQLERLVLRDRNHPSVFLWSIGNEEQSVQTTSTGKRIALSMMRKIGELDPTRTCTYAADVGNEYKGINEVIPVRGFNYRSQFMKDYHRDHPEQPVIGTEMGGTVTTRGIYAVDSVRGYLPDQDLTAPWWASLAEAWWPQTADNNWIVGGFVWTGFDYRGEPTPFQWPDINSHFGILDVCGFPKNLAYYYQSWWSSEKVLHLSPHWNWPGKEGQNIDVWVNSNADQVQLLLNGKDLGKKKMDRNSHLQWQVPYEPGTLEARGWYDGKEIRSRVETTGPPSEIALMVGKTTLFADGTDATVINVRTLDQDGRWVPDAQNLVRFSVTGDARIIGVGNGDPSCHEPDQCAPGAWQRSLFNGYCLVILQSGKTPGVIHFKAESDGLWPGESEILSIEPYPLLNNEIKPFKPDSVSVAGMTKIIGADISFLPELESHGMKFYDNGKQQNPLKILKNHGFNWVRLRIFNNPENPDGYAPGKGWCDLGHTLLMAKRVKAQGMKLLLDFHYSDTWADPQKQFKPKAWEGQDFDQLKASLQEYTRSVIKALVFQETAPDMVQIGNEINHGMVWPDGAIGHPDQLAALIQAGIAGVKEADPHAKIMLHVALGGQYDETALFVDQMMARGCKFDVLGLSFYPKWHGTLEDLRNNISNLVKRYPFPICIVEYSAMKREVNDLVFREFPQRLDGSFIWEPLNTWEKVFDDSGNSNGLLKIYDEYKGLQPKEQN